MLAHHTLRVHRILYSHQSKARRVADLSLLSLVLPCVCLPDKDSRFSIAVAAFSVCAHQTHRHVRANPFVHGHPDLRSSPSALSIAVLGARICQTLVHVVFVQTARAVSYRFSLFTVQLLAMLWMIALVVE